MRATVAYESAARAAPMTAKRPGVTTRRPRVWSPVDYAPSPVEIPDTYEAAPVEIPDA